MQDEGQNEDRSNEEEMDSSYVSEEEPIGLVTDYMG